MKKTTDVFVVTSDTFNLSATNTSYTNLVGNSSTIINTIPSGTISTTGYYATVPSATQYRYDDFWKFDDRLDILWKSFFEKESIFKPITEKTVSHPCDIQETDNGLKIELAAIGLDKSEIDIIVDSETLRVAYRKLEEEKKKEENDYRYFHRSIRKASFDIAWKISSKYDLSKLNASLDKGLLTIDIPFAKENKPKKVEIK